MKTPMLNRVGPDQFEPCNSIWLVLPNQQPFVLILHGKICVANIVKYSKRYACPKMYFGFFRLAFG
jgi:hypothetical protein